MKKIIIAIAVTAVTYCGAAYLTGYFGEKNVRAQIDIAKAQGAAKNVTMELVSFKRGIFTSDVRLSLKLKNSFPGMEQFEIISHSAIRHGPVLFQRGLALGLFSAATSVNVKTSTPALDKEISDIFGASIGTIYSRAYFGSNYTSRWILPAIHFEKNESHFLLAESFIEMRGNFNTLGGSGEVEVGKIEIISPDKTNIKTAPITAKFDIRNIDVGVNISNMDMLLKDITIKTAAGPEVGLKNLAISQQQAVVNKNIDTAVKVSLEKITGPVVVDNIYYHIDVNQMSVAAVKNLSEVFSNAPTNDPTALSAFYVAQMKALLPQLLQEGLMLKLAMGAEYLGLKSQADWEIKYVAPANGKALADITDPVEYLSLVDSTLHISAPESLAKNLPLAPYLGTYVTQEASEYILHATFKAGVLVVGKTTVPQATLDETMARMMPKPQPDDAANSENEMAAAAAAEEEEEGANELDVPVATKSSAKPLPNDKKLKPTK